MPQAPELPPVALVHPLKVASAARSSCLWWLFYGRPTRQPGKALFGLN